jgi:uncharacterized protein (TIGR03437 family)
MKKQILLSVLIAVTVGASAQTISTIAGNGTVGFAGDNGLATSAMLNHPKGMVPDKAGNLYIADLDNSRIRKISASGIITTVAGNGVAGFSGDNGPAVSAMLNGPQAVAFDANGNLIIADTQNRVIRKVDTFGVITTIAGTGTVEGYSGDGGPATQALLHQPVDLAVDSAGSIYFADSSGQRIRKIASNGIITTVAGNGNAGYSGDGALAFASELNVPVSIAFDGSNNLYIADSDNFRIRMVSAASIISTFAGNGTEGFLGDGGPATAGMINYPYGVRVDSQNRLFIADTSNNRVRVVSNGIIFTLVGSAVDGFSGDGGPAVNAELNFPWSLALDSSGNLLIGDRVNDRIRVVSWATALAPPVMSTNGTVNGASYAPALSANGAVSPGGIVAIFGSNFAAATAGANGTPLPTMLSNTSVTMNGTAVPLFYVNSGQINAQVPFEIPTGNVAIQVSVGSQATIAQNATVSAASPGIFTINSQGTGDGAFLHANYLPVNATNPAVASETILIYCTGLGVTTPKVTTGSAAPSNPPGLAMVASLPLVLIGGKPSFVSFAGLAPGFVGLYQINAQIPAGLLAGSQQVTVQMNGIQGNITTVTTH